MNTIWEAIKFIVSRGALYGALLGALYGTLLFPIIGTIFGFFIGGVMGVITGIPLGILLGWMTRQFFTPPVNRLLYLWVAFILSGVVGLTVTGIVMRESWSTDPFPIHVLIAAGAAAYGGARFAKLHIDQSPDPEVIPSIQDAI